MSHNNETGVRDDFQDRFEQRAKVASAEASAEAGHLVVFECVGAQNDQFVQKALDREDVFELFTRIMNDPQCPARCLPFSRTMYELLSGSRPKLATPVVQTATAMIADIATERGLDFSAEINNVGFEVRCGPWHSSLRHHAARKRQ